MSLRKKLVHRFPALKGLPSDSYVVGGAVRDLLLGIEPVDVDIACRDPLAAAKRVGERVIRLGTGEHLSAYRVVAGEEVYDFAQILDHDIAADLARRDFTVNAMAVHLDSGHLLDPHGGQRDIAGRVVRMVDEANFDDDPLRCLKAVRMAVRYRFAMDDATVQAIRKRAPLIEKIAPERVTYELSVIFSSGRFREAIELLRRTALDRPLFGRELPSFSADDVPLAATYALLVENPKTHAKRWRWSSDLLRQVTALQHLIREHGPIALYDAGESVARQLPPVLRALGRSDAVQMPDFGTRSQMTGEEIARLTGLKEGPQLGRIKRALLEAQIRGEIRTREEAERFLGERASRPITTS
jgi:tRNA nucleotidyltransferase/poly(A) polymerase